MSGRSIAILGSVVTVILVPLVLAFPAAIVLVLAPPVVHLFVRYAIVRLVWFIGGAMLVFQVGDGLTPEKLIYMVGIVAASIISVVRFRTIGGQQWARRFRLSLVGSAVLAGWILLVTSIHSLVVMGIEPTMWARDALTYLLIAAAVPIAIDAASTTSLRTARILSIVVGVLAASGFAVVWIQSRGYGATEGEVERSFLASLLAVTVPLALAFALGLAGRRFNLLWVALGCSLIVAVLITGTRTGFVLVAALVGVIGAVSKERVGAVRFVGGAVASIALIAAAVPIAAAAFSSATDVLARLTGIVATLERGFGQDQSGAMREWATHRSASIFQSNPVLGQGLGVFFPNPNPLGVASSFSLDTPMMFPAKFGILGCIVVVVALVLIMYPVIRKTPDTRWLVESTAARGATLVWVALLPLASTTEDKGFAISIALIVLLVGASARDERNRIMRVEPGGGAAVAIEQET
ncbi:hypothetical protein ELQ92_05375 [Labedella populi]|uniref:O-antigen ligase-related domain-containing protein n=1 Tax=Labedella populi TaxID=2498850 RepID=A0A444QGB6_9MICO|nr:O-antigen ligase family protein [Labedella populi]RWZ68631.1 hypothetical protein ELQ92_05375 [Labedella populi]